MTQEEIKQEDIFIEEKKIDDEKIEDATPVIEVDCDFNMTLNSKRFDISLINTSVTIQTLDGKNARGIFVRKYNDQSTLVLNLFALVKPLLELETS